MKPAIVPITSASTKSRWRHPQVRLIAATMFTLLMQPLLAAEPTYPRLAAGVTGSPHNYWDPAFQKTAAKLNFVIINSWPGWGEWRGTSLDKVVREMKALNPALKVFVYIVNNESHDPEQNKEPLYAKFNETITKNGWWLYKRGASGERVPAAWGRGYYQTNMTRFSKRDASGRNFLEWHADLMVEQFAKKAPLIDGFLIDNFFTSARVDGDWNMDGVTDSQKSSEVAKWYREGMAAYVARLREKMPGKLLIGNISDFGTAGAFPEFQKLLDGGWSEGMLGFSWSTETWGGFKMMMEEYRRELSRLKSPNLYIFHQDAAGKLNDYKNFRYGFTVTLMDEGHYYMSNGGSTGYGVIHWYDEFDVKLGRARGGPQMSPWRQGVYRRDFENGIALMNPKGNGRVELDLGEDFRKISGKQDPMINNGQVVRRVVLDDRDGVILLRTQSAPPKARPRSPTGLTVQ